MSCSLDAVRCCLLSSSTGAGLIGAPTSRPRPSPRRCSRSSRARRRDQCSRGPSGPRAGPPERREGRFAPASSSDSCARERAEPIARLTTSSPPARDRSERDEPVTRRSSACSRVSTRAPPSGNKSPAMDGNERPPRPSSARKADPTLPTIGSSGRSCSVTPSTAATSRQRQRSVASRCSSRTRRAPAFNSSMDTASGSSTVRSSRLPSERSKDTASRMGGRRTARARPGTSVVTTSPSRLLTSAREV